MNALPHARERAAASGGFTLIELLVVAGILSGFLMMLVQLVDSGVGMFREGEQGQAIADRGAQVHRTLAHELGMLRGSAPGRERAVATDRLVVQLLPLSLPPTPLPTTPRLPVIRAAVHVDPDRESALVEAALVGRVLAAEPQLDDATLQQKVAELRRHEPLRGHGNLLLLPWHQGDDGRVELRVGWFLPGQLIPIGNGRFADPFAVPVPGTPELPGLALHAVTMPVVRDLLHLEVLAWGQTTRSWSTSSGASGAGGVGGGAPFACWDSARGGWLVDAASGGEFVLDRGPASIGDTSDDVQPHALLIRCVVAAPTGAAAEGLLAEPLGAGDNALHLVNGEVFPGAETGGFIKVGNEWIGYGERDGDTLLGLRRGQRGTAALDHGDGLRVHVGRTVEFVVPVPHWRDDWNG